MKNIYTLLENIGVSIPEDKKAEFEEAFSLLQYTENYTAL